MSSRRCSAVSQARRFSTSSRPARTASRLAASHRTVPAALAPLAIGLCLTLIHLIGIPVDNLSVNPARSTATAIFAEPWALQQLWLFWVAPIIGGAIGGVVYPLVAGNAD